jgi:hypothetical protein
MSIRALKVPWKFHPNRLINPFIIHLQGTMPPPSKNEFHQSERSKQPQIRWLNMPQCFVSSADSR